MYCISPPRCGSARRSPRSSPTTTGWPKLRDHTDCKWLLRSRTQLPGRERERRVRVAQHVSPTRPMGGRNLCRRDRGRATTSRSRSVPVLPNEDLCRPCTLCQPMPGLEAAQPIDRVRALRSCDRRVQHPPQDRDDLRRERSSLGGGPFPQPPVKVGGDVAEMQLGHVNRMRQRMARLTADTTAFSEALTIELSIPTPHSTLSSTAHSTYAAARASSPDDRACSW
jgi:hypothetical protein